MYPEYAKFSSPNNEYNLDYCSPNSEVHALWLCPICGGEYRGDLIDTAKLTALTVINHKVLPGYNSFKVKHPDILNDWDYVNNYVITDPDQISDKSNVSAWWNCTKKENHKYVISPSSRLMFQKRQREPCTCCKGLRRKKFIFYALQKGGCEIIPLRKFKKEIKDRKYHENPFQAINFKKIKMEL